MIELLTGVAIFGLIIGAFSSMFVFFFRSYNFTFEQGRTVEEAKISANKLMSELREARTSEDGAYPLIAAEDQELAFYSDVDDDGQVERVRYFLDGQTLRRGVVEPGVPPVVYDTGSEAVSVISEYVQNTGMPTFYYYNSDWPGDVVTNPLVPAQRLLDTRIVEVSFLINTDSNQQQDFEISSQVMIRNLKTN